MGELACDEQCSDFVTYGHYGPGKIDKRDADQANMLWFKHMLPQIRGRKLYGKTIVEAIQSPGEIVYVPNNVPHAVYNLDETVAMNDKPYFHTAIEESAFQFFHHQKKQKNRPFLLVSMELKLSLITV